MVKRLLTIVAVSIGMTTIVSSCHKTLDKQKEAFYLLIDEEIEKVPQYDEVKENRISQLKERLGKESQPQKRSEITDQIISEYESFVSDSALHYINLNLKNPVVKSNHSREIALLIRKADISAHAGLFGEATEILESIPRNALDSTMLENYYSAYCDLYQYQSEYATDSEFARRHEILRELYIDSVSGVSSPSSPHYVINHAASEARNGNYKEAEILLLDNLKKYESGERPYSIISSILADVYKNNGDIKNYHNFLRESVISDLRGAIKENMAIRALATECYEEGDLERADRYLRQSFADANFFAARMRNAQSSRMLPIIGEAYNIQQKNSSRKLSLLVIFISILAFGFIVIAIFAVMQMRKVRASNKKIQGTLQEVSQLSEKLKDLNKELSAANGELKSSDKIKEQYAVLFMEYCSMAISSLQHYQQTLKVAVAQGNMNQLVRKINSGTIENRTINEFYAKFDEAILNIYPRYVEKVNSLLRPEERIELKPNDSLNTELRIFALIKVGINDSEKIAKFLQCSLSTVYTYRSKMKRKAIDPERFEEELLEL